MSDILPELTNSHPANVREFLSALCHTPLTDLLRGKLTARLNVTKSIAWAELPAELLAVVELVTHKTRLWRSEKLDVAQELAGHFRDGLDAGATAAQLAERFGDQPQAAKLIREARVRCRSVFWHSWIYSLRATGALLAIVVATYLGLAAWFYSSRPKITRFFAAEINATGKGVRAEDRAWPLYREAILATKPYANLKQDGWWIDDQLVVEDAASAVTKLETYVVDNQLPLEFIRTAVAKAKLGFVYGDPADAKYLKRETIELQDDQDLTQLLLPHIQDLRSVARLLAADMKVAAGQADGPRLAADFRAILAVAEHAHPDPFLIEDLVSYAIFQIGIKMITEQLHEQPGVLTDADLVDIAHRLAAFHGGGTIRPSLHGEAWMFEDILQRTFTDDGHGDGHLTAAGWKMLLNFSGNYLGNAPAQDPAWERVVGPGMILAMASRRELSEFAKRWFDECEATHRGPMHTWVTPDPCDERLRQLQGSLTQRLRYMPALLLLPAISSVSVASERLCQQRDGVLTAIALELYHRRHSEWPTTLDELVPRYLPALPLDRFTGNALRYKIAADKPLIYACGFDQQDDGGRHPSTSAEFHTVIMSKPPKAPTVGEGYDWVLFPPPRLPAN